MKNQPWKQHDASNLITVDGLSTILLPWSIIINYTWHISIACYVSCLIKLSISLCLVKPHATCLIKIDASCLIKVDASSTFIKLDIMLHQVRSYLISTSINHDGSSTMTTSTANNIYDKLEQDWHQPPLSMISILTKVGEQSSSIKYEAWWRLMVYQPFLLDASW